MNNAELIDILKHLPADEPVLFPDGEMGYHEVKVVTPTVLLYFGDGQYDDISRSFAALEEIPHKKVLVLQD